MPYACVKFFSIYSKIDLVMPKILRCASYDLYILKPPRHRNAYFEPARRDLDQPRRYFFYPWLDTVSYTFCEEKRTSQTSVENILCADAHAHTYIHTYIHTYTHRREIVPKTETETETETDNAHTHTHTHIYIYIYIRHGALRMHGILRGACSGESGHSVCA
jgi:hypothetical protein